MKRVLYVCVCALGLGACSTLTGHYIADAASTEGTYSAAAQRGETPAPPIDLNTYCFPNDMERTKDSNGVVTSFCPLFKRTAYEKASAAGVGESQEDVRQARNHLVLTIMRRSEDICTYHKGAIMANAAALDFSTGFLSAVLSTLSTAFTPVTTTTALSAGSAISSAAGTGIRANMYQNILTPAIVTEIENVRVVMRKKILARQAEMPEHYSITEALFEVERYHKQCSFYVGVAELAKDRTPKARTKEDIQKEIKELRLQRDELTPKMAAGHMEVEEAKGEYAILSNRIQNLMRLQEIAPGESMLPTPSGAYPADLESTDALLYSHQANVSVADARTAVQQIKTDGEVWAKAVAWAELNHEIAKSALAKAPKDETLIAAERGALSLLEKFKTENDQNTQAIADDLTQAEKFLNVAIEASTIVATKADLAVGAAAAAKLTTTDARDREVQIAKARVSADEARQAVTNARKSADSAMAAAVHSKSIADQARKIEPKQPADQSGGLSPPLADPKPTISVDPLTDVNGR